jgi:hypothetical protein
VTLRPRLSPRGSESLQVLMRKRTSPHEQKRGRVITRDFSAMIVVFRKYRHFPGLFYYGRVRLMEIFN